MADKMIIFREAIEKFADDYVKELRQQLKRNKNIASGDLVKSLDGKVIRTAMGSIFTIQLISEDYLKYVDQGRRPGGKMPPLQAISRWATFKKIPQQAVFPIAKSIAEKGIKPTNVIQKSLDNTLNSKSFSDLEESGADWMETLIQELIFDVSKRNNITVRR